MNIFAKLISVFIVLSLWSMSANTQKFCNSYLQNNRKMVVYSDHNSNGLMLIIGSDYWKVQTNTQDLEFTSKDTQPLGSNQLLNNSYSIAIPTLSNGVVLSAFLIPKSMSSTFDIFESKTKIKTGVIIGASDWEVIAMATFAFYIPSQSLNLQIGFVEQVFNETMNTFNRKLTNLYAIYETTHIRFVPVYQEHTLPDPIKFDGLSNTKEMVAIYSISKPEGHWFYILFWFDSSLKYCLLDECLKEIYKTLIDCGSEAPNTDRQPNSAPVTTSAPQPTSATDPNFEPNMSSGSSPTFAVLIYVCALLLVLIV